MAIVRVTESHEAWSGSVNEKHDYELKRQFKVLTDDMDDGPVTAINASGVPEEFQDYFAGHEEINTAWVKKKSAKRDPVQPLLWYVDVEYSTAQETQNGQSEQNPLLRPYEISWTTGTYSKIIERDTEGAFIGTSAGESFSPRVEIDDDRPILTITRNEADPYPHAQRNSYRNCVNSDEFYGYDVGQAKMSRIDAVKTFEQRGGATTTGGMPILFTFWRVTYEIHFNLERVNDVAIGWNIRRLDEGTYYMVGGQKQNFYDRKGQLMESGLLDGVGGLGSAASPYFRQFFGYKFRPFNVLGLGS